MQSIYIAKSNKQLSVALLNKINQKTKPLGALGELEQLALQIGLIQNTLTPQLTKPMVLVFAGDHGIVNEGVSPYPQAVTAQMVLNFLNGGAAINVFAKQHNFALQVIDSGINHVFDADPLLIDAKVSYGTASFLNQPAMTQLQCQQALTSGADLVSKVMDGGSNVLAFGEMGIGNTSSASCLMSVLCGLPIDVCVGRGTGLDDQGLSNKKRVLQQAINNHSLDSSNPLKVLATFGGFEIAMMVGAMLKGAQTSAILLIDGFIATSALLVAAKLQPNILDYCIFSHCSDESGHEYMLQQLDAKPLLNLGLRLGEGTGAVLAYPLVQAAVNFLNDMASFESAGVSEKSDVS
jgi:nicotinate-nucleotide--dimethylbenzimidazole phosphoribosyltransferase